MNTIVSTGVSPVHRGQVVHVNAHATWLAATVVTVTHARVEVAYHTPPLIPLSTRVSPWLVRPAAGVRLSPAHALAGGDQVLCCDDTPHAVDLVWQAPNRRWVIVYANHERVTVAPHAVLRLLDTTAAAVTRRPSAALAVRGTR